MAVWLPTLGVWRHEHTRVKNREAQRLKRARWRRLGLCVEGGHPRDRRFKQCQLCRFADMIRQDRWKFRKKAA